MTARYNLAEWASSGLGEAWAGYDVYRQRDVPGAQWIPVAQYRPVPGQSRTQTEGAHRAFADYEAPLSTPHKSQPVNYAVLVLDVYGTQSLVNIDDDGNLLNAPGHGSLIVCNAAPYLNQYLEVIPAVANRREERVMSRHFIKRKYAATRVRADEEPDLVWEGGPRFFDHVGADAIRVLEQAVRENRRMCWQHPLGDQLFGALDLGDGGHEPGRNYSTAVTMLRTADYGQVAGYNLPASINLDGTNDFIAVSDAAALDPGTGDFTFGLAADLEDAAVTHASKRAAGDGWSMSGAGGGAWSGVVDGASATVTLTGGIVTSALQVISIAREAGVCKIRDGATVRDTDATASGAIANALKVTVGALNSGASGWAEDKVTGFFYYPRTLTADEHQDLAGYFAGDLTKPRPPGATFFFDRRDARCGTGTRAMSDLGGVYLAEINGDPAFAGAPWPVARLEAT